MIITAELVKELRERTGAGMMECKKALTASNGNIEAAIKAMREEGKAQADKKAGRIAAEGLIVIAMKGDNAGVIAEVNCETDFVARDEGFKAFAKNIAQRALDEQLNDVEQLSQLSYEQGDHTTIEETRQALVAKIGENIKIRRIAYIQSQGIVGHYKHGERIGVLVDLSVPNKELGKDLAMHIAASKPEAISPDDIPEAMVQKEREIFAAQAAQTSGKPADIIEKMTEGRIKKFLNEVSLLGQPFVKDPSKTVSSLLNSLNARVNAFIRYEVGEGIEKKSENFADEVMAQVQGSK